MILLQHNADVNLINGEGGTAKHVTRNTHIRKLIEGRSMKLSKYCDKYEN